MLNMGRQQAQKQTGGDQFVDNNLIGRKKTKKSKRERSTVTISTIEEQLRSVTRLIQYQELNFNILMNSSCARWSKLPGRSCQFKQQEG